MTVCYTLEGFMQNTATKRFTIGFQINNLEICEIAPLTTFGPCMGHGAQTQGGNH